MNAPRLIPENVTHSLNINDPRLTALDLDEPRLVHAAPSLAEFLDALTGNSTVQTVRLGPLVVQVTPEEQLNRLLEAFGRMSALEDLGVSLPRINERKRFSAASLTRFFQTASQIRTVTLWPFVLLDPPSIIDLSVSLRGHSTLQNLMLLNLLFVASNDDDGNHSTLSAAASLDPLLECLAFLPRLENVQLSAGVRVARGRFSPLSAQALVDFVSRAAVLESLALRNLGLGDDHCIRLAEDALSRHRALKALDLRFNDAISVAGWAALRRSVDDNHRLQWLDGDLEAINPELRRDLELALLLNRAGRHTLLDDDGSATPDDRINVFSRTEGSLDATYVLLRSCPTALDQLRGSDQVAVETQNGLV